MEQAEKKFQSSRPGVGAGGDSTLRRRIYHRQQEQSRFVEELPSDLDGKEGDVVFFENPSNFNKLEQYVKHRGEWINISKGRPVNDSLRVRKFIQAKSG